MSRKYKLITELYTSTCSLVVSSPEKWEEFLRSVCNNYKLRFDEQLLLFAQRPDATAVLEIGGWNKLFNRWVNRGATGIAVFEDVSRGNQRLIHYFDISDTHENENSRPVPIWRMKPEYEDDVIDTLENTFGAISDKSSLASSILCAAGNAAEDNIPDYVGDLLYTIDNSFLEGLNEDIVASFYNKIVTNSVAYMIMSRLGIDTDRYFDRTDFEHIVNFNTRETLNALGFAISDIAKMGLVEIAKTIVSLDRDQNRIEEPVKEVYNKNIDITNERSFNDDKSNIHETGKLQSSESYFTGTGRSSDQSLRNHEEKLPQEQQEGVVLQSADELQAQRTFERSGAEGDSDVRTSYIGNDSSGRNNRGAEGIGYDGLGSQDEQHPQQGGGDSSERGSVQLEYYDRWHGEDLSIPFFHNSDTIREILGTTPHLNASKDEIKAFFEDEFDEDLRTEFIKGIFNNDYTEVTLSDGTTAGYKTFQNVLHLWQGTYDNKLSQGYYDWAVITRHFEAMRLLGELSDTYKPLPSLEGQLNIMSENRAEDISSAFVVSQEIIDVVLCKGSRVSEGKFRIYEEFQKNFSKKDRIEFLKHEYGIGGSCPIITGTYIDEMHDGKGISITKGLGIDAPGVMLNWSQVEKRIGELISLDRYLNPKEKKIYPEWLEREEFRRAELAERQKAKEILMYAPQETLAEDVSKENVKYSYHAGDTVYIGANEYNIASVDVNRVVVFDTRYPLFSEEMSRDEFELKVRENPSNNHLIVSEGDIQKDTGNITDELKPMYRDYLNVKSENPDNLVLYQVGDFFEAYNEDAKKVADALNLTMTTRPVSDSQRVSMVGLPKHRLETCVNMLIDRGYDITVSALENKDRKTYTLVSSNKEDPVESKPIGRIDYLSSDGKEVINSIEYTSPYQLEKDIKEEHSYGVPMKVIFYADERGGVVPHTYIDRLSPPLFDVEVLESPYNRTLIDELTVLSNELAPIVPNFEKPKKNIRVESYDLHPDIPMSERHNFNLSQHPVSEAGKKERFRRNMDAIRVLKECEFDNRFATPEEQITLSQYVGWGGIPEAFDENNASWSNEFQELYTALSPDEYSAARESTLTAFYTPPVVIQAVYKAMEQIGFRSGNILEPSCGIGHFIGLLPDSMVDSKIYGVELDTISAGIAQQLYQKTSIAAQPYEETNLPDSFFDAVVGNVPFGDFKVSDKKYNKHNFLIHDYFFAKSLDKLRPGGIMALITSKGTMDKENPAVRKYIAQRAELLGAIRLPNNTFKGNAGTEVVSDILILQKRDRIIDIEPEWVYLGKDGSGITMNSYFVEHPEMILGKMAMVSGRFGPEASCLPLDGADLTEQLSKAVSNIHGEFTSYQIESEVTEDNSIPAEPTVRNFSYTIVDDKLYFRENSVMNPVAVSATAENRIKGIIAIRDSVRTLIELQTEDYPESEIKAEQEHLNSLYDRFTKKYGLINSRANKSAFSQDSSFSLVSALEVLRDDGSLDRKADMFFKRTINPHVSITSVETSQEALAVSMGERARVDMAFMSELSGKSEDELYNELEGIIFLNPMFGYGNHSEPKYLMADEYLSGNVREKLAWAKKSAEVSPEDYTIHVKALEQVQPKDLSASEISVRLGATWISTDIVKQFIYEFLDTPYYSRYNIKVHFSEYTGEWNISGKNYDKMNVKANSTYGTPRVNAYKIIEETLNLKDVRVFDYVEDAFGKKKAVLNKKETAIAQSKQELIKQGFQDWIWSDPQRREHLTTLYNEKFNSLRPREYDGSHITFEGMNPEIELREHQKNAVAHILYGGNTLLAHAVGAGKTFEMAAASMELKRLGLCNKSMFVVPNHLTEQWAAEFLQLYPSANILVATKKDFETKNRKRFCGRIATGDYDAIIIGHSQFEKIPMSLERQKAILEQQINEITNGIIELKQNKGDNFSVKQLERSKKSIKVKLDKLNDQSRKDDVVTFEELGVDRLFVDESHYYKNLFLYTKMRNVGGIAQTEAQKSSDLFMKCRYLDEITGGRGTVFATGTPISNSMVELYTIQRYLQYETLERNGLQHFDAWASTFGETISAVELTPEGTGYRAKTRFARFYNLPELMSMFKEVADIKTADMLNLPVPKANYHNIAVKPSETQEKMVQSLADRAEKVRQGMVDSSTDNMLKITNDGRKLALDQRMINDMMPDFEGSKVNACVDNVYRIWKKTAENKSVQLIFCDLSTPKSDGRFSVYNDIRNKLIKKGVPSDEIKFIHEANTEVKKLELFKKAQKGEVRVLLGSTQKMGAGTNVQDRLIALHDLDCPWRPSDLEQRAGRIIRQGNMNPEVDMFKYVTEQTFDAYLYQLVEGKQKFSSQIMTSKSPVRSAEDIDETALSYAEIKMLATGNPHIKEKMDLDIQVQKLRLLKSNYLSERYALEDKIIKFFPKEIARYKTLIAALKNDINTVKANPRPTTDNFVGMTVKGVRYTEKSEAGKAILAACKAMSSPTPTDIGEYRGFGLELSFDTFLKEYVMKLKGTIGYSVSLGTDIHGNITRCDNVLDGLEKRLENATQELKNTEKQLEVAKVDVTKPFFREDELQAKTARLNELNAILNVDKRENEIVDSLDESEEQELLQSRKISVDVGDSR